MFIVIVRISEQARTDKKRLQGHRTWVKQHIDNGIFVLAGSFIDEPVSSAGMVFAHCESREQLDAIIATDSYFNGGATYEIHEYKPSFVDPHLAEYLR